MRKTYCKDCGTFLDTITQELAKELDKKRVPLSADDQAFADKVVDHGVITKDQIIRATEVMLAEAQRLEEGEYTLLSIGNMFIDCADRAPLGRRVW